MNTAIRKTYITLLLLFSAAAAFAQAPETHPDTSKPGWSSLFQPDLSNAIKPDSVWSFADGVLTATRDNNIWSEEEYTDFILDLEFMTAPGTNSGVVVHGSNMDNWIPNSVEIQIADDYSEEWSKAPATWQCGAFFRAPGPGKK